MSERLFIRLGKTSEHPCSWLVWSEQEQEIIASGELADAASLSSLAERAGNRPVDVLVPAASMTLTQIALPEKGQRQALKALPYMLEESLATDVDRMHFVVGPREGELLNVAAVAHEQMQTWLAWLQDAGLKVKRIVPDCLALPLEQCRWAAMSLGNEYLIRTSEGGGISLPKAWSAFALPQLVKQATARNDNAQINVACYSEDIAIDGVQVDSKPLDLPMMVLAKGVLNAPIDLLCGIYKPKREYSKHLLVWKNAAIILVLAIVLALVNKGLMIHQLNNDTEVLRAQSEAIFKQAVPGVSRIVNMRSQMDSALRSMQGQGGGAAFFEMLDGLKPAFSKVPDLKPNSLRFEGNRNELRMQVTAQNYAQIDQFKEIVAKDYQLDGGAMNSTDENVTSTLTLRSK
ncbi:type II secretion system protein GspL [Shewanella sp. MF05960]|uniref:type II secretion system protein GspL n=1 Tax=Shewanella sp. MF05960 TaxID=3434874 RepID=UPI003D7AC940